MTILQTDRTSQNKSPFCLTADSVHQKPQENIEEDRVQVQIPEGEEVIPAAQRDPQLQGQAAAATPHNTRKSGRQKKKPERFGTAATEEQTRQLSPRERKRRQSQAKFGLRKTFVREAGQWKVGTEQEGEEADKEKDICGIVVYIYCFIYFSYSVPFVLKTIFYMADE